MVVIDIFLLQNCYKMLKKLFFFWNVINNLAEQHNKLHSFPF